MTLFVALEGSGIDIETAWKKGVHQDRSFLTYERVDYLGDGVLVTPLDA
jgi:hypothetical protein